MRARARADPDLVVAEERAVHQGLRDRRCGNGATPPGSNPVACTTSSGLATRTSAAPSGGRTASSSARRSPGHERQHVGAVADEDERLDDLRQLAADRLRCRPARWACLRRTPRSARRPPPRAETAETRSTGSGQSVMRDRLCPSRVLPFDNSRTRRGTNMDQERMARTESAFREVNEAIAETAERFEAEEADFVCECADPECAHRMTAALEDYEEVRSEADPLPARARPPRAGGRARRRANRRVRGRREGQAADGARSCGGSTRAAPEAGTI